MGSESSPLPASNTPECIQRFLGQKLVGYVEEQRGDDRARLLIFEDGCALSFSVFNVGYWVTNRVEVARSVNRRRADIDAVYRELERATIANLLAP